MREWAASFSRTGGSPRRRSNMTCPTPLWAVAQQGKARCERLQKETEYNDALADATACRGKSEWSGAIAAYERALKVYPDKDEVKKALKETRETAHREAVKLAMTKALDY